MILGAGIANGQESRSSDLYKALRHRDSLIFEVGFNQCNMAPYDTLISDDIEFYHDRGGIEHGKVVFIASVKNNICGQQFRMIRKLADSSLQVFPLYNNGILYGAIQQGEHEFYTDETATPKHVGAAKFIHLWLIERQRWQLKRVLSYDHH